MSAWTPILEKTAIRFFEMEKGPAYSISALPVEEIKRLKRKDFDSEEALERYIEYKITLERIMRSAFLSKGGRAPLKYPLFFAVNETDRYKAYFHNPGCIKIPIRAFESDTISFTYGGTSTNAFFRSKGHPTKRKIYTIHEIDDVMRKYPNDEEISVEMEVWCDAVVLRSWSEQG